jgi:lipopolysaccharide export system permease protein
MLIVSRYIFNKLIKPISSFSLILIGFIWLSQSLRFIEIIINHNISIIDYFALIFFLMPDLLVTVLPICILLGTLFSYQRFNYRHETTGFKSLGFSDLQIAKPALLIGVVAFLLINLMNFYVVPKSFKKFCDKEYLIRNKMSAIFLREGTFNNLGDVTIYVKKKIKNGYLEDVFIYSPEKSDKNSFNIIAKSGSIKNLESGAIIYLNNGIRQEVDRFSKKISSLQFESLVYNLSDLFKITQNRNSKLYEKTILELLESSKSSNIEKWARKKMESEAHQKIITPFLSILNAIFAVNVSLYQNKNLRNKKKYLALIGIVIGLLFHGLLISLINLNASSFFYIVLAYILVIFFIFINFFKILKNN